MKAICSRTSQYGFFDLEEPPCEEAIGGEVVMVDVRAVDDPAKLRIPSDRDSWYSKGTNHRVVCGCIMRDLPPEKVWMVEIPTIGDLMAFTRKYDRVILSTNTQVNPPMLELEIYDDYRE